MSNSSGYVCSVIGFYITTTDCNDRSLPFVFNTPQTITVSEGASGVAIGGDDVAGQESAGAWGPEVGGFAFFNAQGQPLYGVSYTLVPGETPAPEPGTLPLVGGGIVCAALIALRRRRRTHSPA